MRKRSRTCKDPAPWKHVKRGNPLDAPSSCPQWRGDPSPTRTRRRCWPPSTATFRDGTRRCDAWAPIRRVEDFLDVMRSTRKHDAHSFHVSSSLLLPLKPLLFSRKKEEPVPKARTLPGCDALRRPNRPRHRTPRCVPCRPGRAGQGTTGPCG